jgi:basic membrane protein A
MCCASRACALSVRATVVMLVLALMAAAAAGCAKKDGATPSPTQAAAETAQAVVRTAMVADIGGLDDKGFNALSYAGLERASKELSAEVAALESKTSADYPGHISQLAVAGYSPVFAVGYLMTDALKQQAVRFPGVTFVGVDIVFDPVADNVIGLSFKEQEAGYLAGVVAGELTTRTGLDSRLNAREVVGFVGGMKIPPVQRFAAGFTAGVRSVAPGVSVKSIYVDSFTDARKGRAAARSLIRGGADVIFAAAGPSGSGAAAACKRYGALFIGVDADQYETTPGIGDTIVTSAVKRVDNAVFRTVADAAAGRLQGGMSRVFGLAEDGVGLAPFHEWEATLPQDVKDAVAKARDDVVSGAVTVPESTAGLSP